MCWNSPSLCGRATLAMAETAAAPAPAPIPAIQVLGKMGTCASTVLMELVHEGACNDKQTLACEDAHTRMHVNA
eukprot:6182159-Pleurochrysis_carterae.AAC.2